MANLIRAILFDLDGVLIDFAEYHYLALNEALALLHLAPIDHQEHLHKFDGLSTRQKLHKLERAGRVHAHQLEAIYHAKQEATLRLAIDHLKPDKGKVAMCRALQKEYHLACVSNCIRASVDALLQRAGLDAYMVTTISNEDVDHPKPAPDSYQVAVTRLVLQHRVCGVTDCLAVEDNVRGVEAAVKAGVRVWYAQYDAIYLPNLIEFLETSQAGQ